MKRRKTVHPFPARMGDDIVDMAVSGLSPDSLVLDPMCGSGTTLVRAVMAGHRAIGIDSDPLAVLVSKVACVRHNREELAKMAADVVARAKKVADPALPWADRETRDFIRFWFGRGQADEMAKLALAVMKTNGTAREALRVALSNLVIRKRGGASRSMDSSRAKPRRTKDTASPFSPFSAFSGATARIVRGTEGIPVEGRVTVLNGDARDIPAVPDGTVDAVVTSPPYLNAVDYMRGHRLALVWLGFSVKELRAIRKKSVGNPGKAEKGADLALASRMTRGSGRERLGDRDGSMTDRYALDLAASAVEIFRVLKPGGRVVQVVGNVTIRGNPVRNDVIAENACVASGLVLSDRRTRELPERDRTLPFPGKGGRGSIGSRMGRETILVFSKPDDDRQRDIPNKTD